jgi:uncharacterized alkaline shock family protein YloU
MIVGEYLKLFCLPKGEVMEYNTMDKQSNTQISVSVIEKLRKMAATEVDGVSGTRTYTTFSNGILSKINIPRRVDVDFLDGMANITIGIIVKYGTKLPEVSKRVKENVKDVLQNTTGIAVSKVNVVICGVEPQNIES